MAVVLPFLRPSLASGWSPSERARLSLLAERLPAAEAGLEVVFGVTDAGDPWCVVQDRYDDVLIHVARIDGRILVHHVAEDIISEGAELWSVLLDLLQTPDLPEAAAEVIPFDLRERKAQVLIALLTVAALYGEAAISASTPGPAADETAGQDQSTAPAGADASPETPVFLRLSSAAGALPPVEASPSPTSDTPTEAAVEQVATSIEGQAAAKVLESAVEAPERPPAKPHSQPAEKESILPAVDRPIIAGGNGDDRLTGTASAETLSGGDGNDVLRGGGAPEGEVDLLIGGRGDDQIEVNAAVVAIGGEGADRFTFEVCINEGGGSVFLGVVLDFSAAQGDILDFGSAPEARVLSAAVQADVLASARDGIGAAAQEPMPGLRVGLDFDGDQREDAYVLLGGLAFLLDPSAAGDAPWTVVGEDAGSVADVQSWVEPMPPVDGLLL